MSISAGMRTSGWAQGLHAQSSTQLEILGSLRITADGRKFRYAKAGATALVAGRMGTTPAPTANHVNMNVAAAAVGSYQVTVTLGATAATADQYKDGWLDIQDGTGEGHRYRVASNPAADASATCTVTLVDPIRVALVASGTSEVSLYKSAFDGVAVSTTEELNPVGVAPRAVTASYYYWSQTGGECICAVDGTPTVGTLLILSDAVAGNLEIAVNDYDEPRVGWLRHTAVDGEFMPVYLTID